MARHLARLLLCLVVLAGLGWAARAAYTPYTLQVFDVTAFGAVGDGVTINNLAVQSAVNGAAVAGGAVRFPCGVFKMTAAVTATIAAGKNMTISGFGQECTQIFFSASNGFQLTMGNQYSTANLADMSLTTDQIGGYTGFSEILPSGPGVNQASASAASSVQNVFFRGYDQQGANTEYWSTSFYEVGISNITFEGGGCRNVATTFSAGLGLCYSLNGNVGGQFYGVVYNFHGVTVNNCNIGIYYGDYVQGVSLVSTNLTGCSHGVTTPVSPGGTLSELVAVNSQFETAICSICIYDTNTSTLGFVGLGLTNNTFITAAGTTIILNGTGWNIDNNTFGSVGGAGLIAIDIIGNAASGGLINDNVFNAFPSGIKIEAGVNSQARIKHNLFIETGGTDYVIGSGAQALITDDQPRNFSAIPTCTTGLAYSTFSIADPNVATFRGTITAGGGSATNAGHAECIGGNLLYY